MNKKILWGIIILLIILVGGTLAVRFFLDGDEDTWLCQEGSWVKHGNPSSSVPTSGCGEEKSEREKSVGLTNPASTNCVDKGGTLEIKTDETGGQYGVCKFANGRECEEWKFFRGECRADILDCATSQNSGIKKEFRINIADIKDSAKYLVKRQEAVNLINQCYEVKLIEEYEIQPGEVSAQEGTFKNKISVSTRVFDKLKFYPKMELADYEGVALDGGLTYATDDGYNLVFNFYRDSVVAEYRSTPTPSEQELRWTDIDTTQKVIVVKFTRSDNGKTLVNFNFIEPLSVD